jgi:iron only hydrogenase large subunit-like protein
VTIEAEGKPSFKMALAYGFRNIQNIVQKIKRKKCDYHFVEIMACPSGCNNGGAQIRPEGDETAKERLCKVEQLYASLPVLSPLQVEEVERLYQEWLGGAGSPKATKMLHTSYHEVEKMTIALAIKW